MARQDDGILGRFTPVDASQLRLAGTVLAGGAGAGLGVLGGISWLAFRDGDSATGVALLVVGLLFVAVLLFLVLVVRVLGRIASEDSRTHGHASLERRVLELELEHAAADGVEDQLELVDGPETPIET